MARKRQKINPKLFAPSAGMGVLAGELLRQLTGSQFLVLLLAVWLWGMSRNPYSGLLLLLGVFWLGAVILEYGLKRIYKKICLTGYNVEYSLKSGEAIPRLALKEGDELFLKAGEIVPAELEIVESHNLYWQEGNNSFSWADKRIIAAGGIILSGQLWGRIKKTEIPNKKEWNKKYRQALEKLQAPYHWQINLIAALLLLLLFLLAEPTRLFGSLAMILALGGMLGADFFPLRLYLLKAYWGWKKNGLLPESLNSLAKPEILAFNFNGSLTSPDLQVKEALIGKNLIRFTGQGFSPQGSINKEKIGWTEILFFKTAALCNNAHLFKGDIPIEGHFRVGENWQIAGEPLEGALLVMAARAGIWRESLEKKEDRLDELPFTGFRRRMSVLYQNEQNIWLYSKGAVDSILSCCTRLPQEDQPFTEEQKQDWREQALKWNREGYRVIALAAKEIQIPTELDNWEELENNLIFLGLAALQVSLQPEAVKVIRQLKAAGIRPLLLTGESQELVEALTLPLGLGRGNLKALSGKVLTNCSERLLKQRLPYCEIVAEANPAEKAKILELSKVNNCWLVGEGISEMAAAAQSSFACSPTPQGAFAFLEWSSLLNLSHRLQTLQQKTADIFSYRLTGLLVLWGMTLLSGVGQALLSFWQLLLLGLGWTALSLSGFWGAADPGRFAWGRQKELWALGLLTLLLGSLLWLGDKNYLNCLLFQGMLCGGLGLAFFYFSLFKGRGFYWLLVQIGLSLLPFWQSFCRIQVFPLKYWLLIYGLFFLPFALKELIGLIKKAFWRKVTYFKI